MNLRGQILKEHTKANCEKIIAWVGDDASRFNELFRLFLTDESRVTQRAAWPLSYCAIAHPGFIKENFGELIDNLKKEPLHNAIKRNTVRLLQFVPLPEKYEGDVMNLCFHYLESPNEAVAIKASSLTILGNLAKKYPEIIPEIKLLIKTQIDHQSAAFRQRAKKFLADFPS